MGVGGEVRMGKREGKGYGEGPGGLAWMVGVP